MLYEKEVLLSLAVGIEPLLNGSIELDWGCSRFEKDAILSSNSNCGLSAIWDVIEVMIYYKVDKINWVVLALGG